MRQVALFSTALFVAAAAGGCQRDGTPSLESESYETRIEIEVAPVERTALTADLELIGTIIPAKRTKIVSEVDGVIEEIAQAKEEIKYEIDGQKYSTAIALNLGHRVKKGDLLVQIEKTDFELGAAVAKANMERAQRELEQLLAWHRAEEIDSLRAMQREAAAVHKQSAAEMKRANELFEKSVMTESEHDEKVMSASAAAARLARAEAELKIAEAGPTKEEIAVAKAKVTEAQAELNRRQRMLEQTSITAPYDAVITDRYLDVGDRVTVLPRMEILEIMDIAIVAAQVGVPEQYLGKFSIGDRATVRAEGVATPLPGIVTVINGKVDFETRTFRIRVAVDNRDMRLKPGTFARVALPVTSSSEALTIASSAITHQDGQPVVYVHQDGKVHVRPVTIGVANSHRAEIQDGLVEGEEIVVSDTSLLTDGMSVQVSAGNAVAELPRRRAP